MQLVKERDRGEVKGPFLPLSHVNPYEADFSHPSEWSSNTQGQHSGPLGESRPPLLTSHCISCSKSRFKTAFSLLFSKALGISKRQKSRTGNLRVLYLGTPFNNWEHTFCLIWFQWVGARHVIYLPGQSVLFLHLSSTVYGTTKKLQTQKFFFTLSKVLNKFKQNMTFILAKNANKKLHEQITSLCKNGKWSGILLSSDTISTYTPP